MHNRKEEKIELQFRDVMLEHIEELRQLTNEINKAPHTLSSSYVVFTISIW